MIETAMMAGHIAAHGVWSVSEGETLIPILAHQTADGERTLSRYLLDDLGEAARAAQDALYSNENDAVRAVIVIDTFLHSDDGKVDALVVEAVLYGPSPVTMRVAVPYVPLTETTSFAIHRPRFLDLVGLDNPDFDELSDAFFQGVNSHEQAAAIWTAHEISAY
ncbi:hypothetical protein ABZ816_01520 [Actinosynnema sp. NPDC047251]|nr:hypothetical protein [Saccharothrix espanaensis]